MTTSVLPGSIVLDFPEAAANPFLYTKDDGSVGDGSDSVFNAVVKIVVEQATVDTKYVHLRFSYNNKYWQKNTEDSTSIVAVSSQPVEDTTDPSCTLFEPTLASGKVTFTHVQTGWPVLMNNSTSTLYVDENGSATALGFVDGATLVQLPTNIALKGPNGKYLIPNFINGYCLQFSSDDPNESASGHTVTLLPYGFVRIFADSYSSFWWTDLNVSGALIAPTMIGDSASDTTTHFWPIKIDDSTIALQSATNNLFCAPVSGGNFDQCLAANSETTTSQTNLQLQELVSARQIYNVVYRMEDARIYGETPYLAGSSSLLNSTEQDESMAVSITYQDEKSYTFSRGFSMSLGVDTTIEAGVPFIFEEKIEISFNISGSFQWDTTTTTTTSVTASGTVVVPAMSSVTVDYIGTRGTCNVPYSYTQQDKSSTTGAITYYNQIDGIYEGVSYYDFQFQVREGSLQPV